MSVPLACPCLPSPLSIPAFITCPHPQRSPLPLPSAIAALSHQCVDNWHQHTGIYASPSPYLHILKSLGSQPFSLSLPLLSPGEHPWTWHAGTVLHYNTYAILTEPKPIYPKSFLNLLIGPDLRTVGKGSALYMQWGVMSSPGLLLASLIWAIWRSSAKRSW